MTIQKTVERTDREIPREVSMALRDVHRALIDFSRERYELEHEAVRTRGELLGLLVTNEAFAWLRPLSGLIAEIEELTTRDGSPTAAETEEIRARVELLTTPSDDVNAFGSRYVSLLSSEPLIAMSHADLRAVMAHWERRT